MKNIAIYGGGWKHNMGNAFIQIGSKYTIEQIFPDANIHFIDTNPHTPPTSTYRKILDYIGKTPLLHFLRKPEQNLFQKRLLMEFRMSQIANLDAVILSGVWLTTKYIIEHSPYLLELKSQGTKIIMNGVGGTHYNKKEYEDVKDILLKIQPDILITRDDVAYDHFCNISKNTAKGIDVGFFVNDVFTKPFSMNKYNIYCFDRSPIPPQISLSDNAVITHHADVGLQHHNYGNHKIFYSEMVDDYLNLYANANTVWSDRVHACVATLAFGNKAQLIDTTPRAYLFERVGAVNIRNSPVSINTTLLAEKKNEHITTLKQLILSL